MSELTLPQSLHHRATLGEKLSPQEQEILNRWYEQQDQEEAALLANSPTTGNIAQVRTEIGVILSQIKATAQRIQSLEAENEKLRQEIEVLERLVAQKQTAQSA